MSKPMAGLNSDCKAPIEPAAKTSTLMTAPKSDVKSPGKPAFILPKPTAAPESAYDMQPPQPHYAREVVIKSARKEHKTGAYQVLISLGDGQPKWMRKDEATKYISARQFDDAKELADNGVWDSDSVTGKNETKGARRSDRLKQGSMPTDAVDGLPLEYPATQANATNGDHQESKSKLKNAVPKKESCKPEAPKDLDLKKPGDCTSEVPSSGAKNGQRTSKMRTQGKRPLSDGGPVRSPIKTEPLPKKRKTGTDGEGTSQLTSTTSGPCPGPAPVADVGSHLRRSERTSRATPRKAAAMALAEPKSGEEDQLCENPTPEGSGRPAPVRPQIRPPGSKLPKPVTAAKPTQDEREPVRSGQCLTRRAVTSHTMPVGPTEHPQRNEANEPDLYGVSDCETISNPTLADSDSEDDAAYDEYMRVTTRQRDTLAANLLVAYSQDCHAQNGTVERMEAMLSTDPRLRWHGA